MNHPYSSTIFYAFSEQSFRSFAVWLALNEDASCSSGPVDMARISSAPPLSDPPVCQMAGGFESPDIHQCLAVSCSRSSDLTCRLVQQNSLPLLGASPNDAAKWSSVSWEPNKNAANMAWRSNTDVQLPVLGEEKEDANQFQTICQIHELRVPYGKTPFSVQLSGNLRHF